MKMGNTCLLVWFVVVIWGVTSATSTTPSQDCSSIIISTSDCFSFVIIGSTLNKPEGGCCNGLKYVLKTAPECICKAFYDSVRLGLSINATKALTLASACGVNTSCKLPGAPVGSPAHSPKSSAASPKSFQAFPPSSTSGSPDEAPATSIANPETPNLGGPTQLADPVPAPGKSGASVLSPSLVSLFAMVVVSFS